KEVEVEPIGKGVHQLLEPLRALRVLLLQSRRINEELHTQILVSFRLTFRLSQAAHRIDIVRLHPIKVVFSLCVLRAEDSIGIRLSVNVGDAPIVADDGHMGSFLLPACNVPLTRNSKSSGRGGKNNKNEQNKQAAA